MENITKQEFLELKKKLKRIGGGDERTGTRHIESGLIYKLPHDLWKAETNEDFLRAYSPQSKSEYERWKSADNIVREGLAPVLSTITVEENENAIIFVVKEVEMLENMDRSVTDRISTMTSISWEDTRHEIAENRIRNTGLVCNACVDFTLAANNWFNGFADLEVRNLGILTTKFGRRVVVTDWADIWN